MTFFACLIFSQAGNLFTPDRVYQFAEHLYSQGDYQAALAEYRRYFFLTDSPPEDVTEKIIKCLAALGRYDEALTDCARLGMTAQKDYYAGAVYFLAGNYDSARARLDRAGAPYDSAARKMIGLSFAEEYDFKNAGGYLALPPVSPGRRSPFAGGAFALVPGGGHFYAGKIDDGIYSFLVVGIASILSYYYHERGENLKFGIALTAAAVFYAGNIYGGINACQNFNRAENERYLEKIREANPIDLK
jgi:tetratricopeptide (TPR) repeat protein